MKFRNFDSAIAFVVQSSGCLSGLRAKKGDWLGGAESRKRFPQTSPAAVPVPFFRGRAGGFTLIELLIVVAIVAIMSAATMAVVIAPSQENARAETQMDLETGAALFFSRLAAEVHESAGIETAANPLALVVAPRRPGARWTAYFVDNQKKLRHAETDEGQAKGILRGDIGAELKARSAALVPGVVELKAVHSDANGLWTISLRAETERLNETFAIQRQVELAPGNAWTGGPR